QFADLCEIDAEQKLVFFECALQDDARSWFFETRSVLEQQNLSLDSLFEKLIENFIEKFLPTLSDEYTTIPKHDKELRSFERFKREIIAIQSKERALAKSFSQNKIQQTDMLVKTNLAVNDHTGYETVNIFPVQSSNNVCQYDPMPMANQQPVQYHVTASPELVFVVAETDEDTVNSEELPTAEPASDTEFEICLPDIEHMNMAKPENSFPNIQPTIVAKLVSHLQTVEPAIAAKQIGRASCREGDKM